MGRVTIPNIQLKQLTKPGPSLGGVVGQGLGQGFLSTFQQGLGDQRALDLEKKKKALEPDGGMGMSIMPFISAPALARMDPGMLESLQSVRVADINEATKFAQRINRTPGLQAEKLSSEASKQVASLEKTVPMIRSLGKTWERGNLGEGGLKRSASRFLAANIPFIKGTGLAFQKSDPEFARYMADMQKLAEVELRKATGAATNAGEKIDYLSFMPMPLDNPDMIEVKLSQLLWAVNSSITPAINEMRAKGDMKGAGDYQKYKERVYGIIRETGANFGVNTLNFGADGADVSFNQSGQATFDPDSGAQRRDQAATSSGVKDGSGVSDDDLDALIWGP